MSIAVAVATVSPFANAQSFTVTSSSHEGPGSLTEAITAANAWAGSGPFTISFDSSRTITLQGELPIFNNSRGVEIHGNGSTIDGGSTSNATGYRVFFLDGGATSISNLTIQNANARGGTGGAGSAGSLGGGGGAGLGGGIFVNQGSLVVSNVGFVNNRAVGGAGGGGGSSVNVESHSGGGGGGMGGTGGAGGNQTVPDAIGGGGGGGFGLGATGGSGSAFALASTGAAGNLPGSAGGSVDFNGGIRQGGSDAGGGGGGNRFASSPVRWAPGAGGGSNGQSVTNLSAGGNGGFGGGGGGAGFLGSDPHDGVGGNGGFGGGGGGASVGANARGGNGGFGGGGGGGSSSGGFGAGGTGGFGGGNGNLSGGGGGLGAGGAIFVRAGASVTVIDSTFTGGAAEGGLDGFGQAFGAGQGVASGVFLGGNTTYTVSAGQTFSPDLIGGSSHGEASGVLIKNGAGVLNLTANSFLNGLTVQDGVVALSGLMSYGGGGIRLEGGELRISNALSLGAPATPVEFTTDSALLRVTGSTTLSGPFIGGARLAIDAGNVVNFNATPGSLEVLGQGLLVLGNSSPIGGNITVKPEGRLRVASNGRANNQDIVIEGGAVEATSADIFNFDPTNPSGSITEGNLVISAGGRFETNQTQALRSIRLSNGTVDFTNPAQPLRMRSGQIIATAGVNEVNAAIVGSQPGLLSITPSAGAVLRIHGSIDGANLLRHIGEGVTEMTGTVNSASVASGVSWSLLRGVLAVSSDQALGPAGAMVSFAAQNANSSGNPVGNPVLRFDASTTVNRPISIDQGSAPLARGTIDTNGHDVVHTGELAGVGKFIKTGSGTLKLAGTNTLTGTTTVSAGTLAVSDLPDSPLIVEGAATLAPGGSIGALTLGQDLTLGGGSSLQIEFDATAASLVAGVDYDTILSAGRLDLRSVDPSNPVELSFDGTGVFSGTELLILGDFAQGILLPTGFDVADLFRLTGDLGGVQGVTVSGNQLLAVPALAGDYNGDSVVDAADYTVWRDNLGSTTSLAADGSGNGVIDNADLGVWQANYGATATATSAAVPEPAGLAALVSALLVTAKQRRKTASRHLRGNRLGDA